MWFTPDLVVTNRPLGSLAALAKQFFGSGQWRREVVRFHPGTVSLRYLAAPVATATVALGAAVGLVAALGGPGWLAAGWVAPAAYLAGAVGTGLIEGRNLPWRARAWLPAMLATMHLAWDLGSSLGLGRFRPGHQRRTD